MTKPPTTVVIVAIALVVGGVMAVAHGAGEKERAADTAQAKPGDKGPAKDKAATKDKDKDQDKKEKEKKEPPPACISCGATCCLVPFCVCEPGTKKKPTYEFEVTCDPVCVPCCGSKPWPFGRKVERSGCTSCCSEPCECRAWVRSRKKIKRETGEEDVPTIKRTVAYVCRSCSGDGPDPSCASCCGPDREVRPTGWWAVLTGWWPRP
jgi:hypothetical protein